MSDIQDTKKCRNAIVHTNLSKGLTRLAIFAAVLSVMFAKPLLHWVRLALDSDTFSYVILIPAVSVYLAWLKWKTLRGAEKERRADKIEEGELGPTDKETLKDEPPHPIQAGVDAVFGPAMACWGLALVILIAYWLALANGWTPTRETALAATMSAYYLGILGGGLMFLRRSLMKEFQFAAAFLAFIIPFPTPMTQAIEVFYQYTSAEVSYWFLTWSGTPVLRDGLTFKIPGITMRVAQECSGIRSSLVLFICSLLAGHMFLRTRWKKVFLTVFVIPLGIVRNGFRILTIGLLCVHIGPEMIHSAIHKRGGPLFFALSLIPFFLVLWWLVKGERKKAVDSDQSSVIGDQ